MKDWQDFPDDDELDRADDLLGQADALLRRHRGDTAAPPARTPPPTDHGPAGPVLAMPPAAAIQVFDDDDLPILTEVVEDLDLPAEIFQPPAAPFSMAAAASAAAMPSFVRSPAPAELTPVREPSVLEPPEPPPEPILRPAPIGQPTSQWPPEPPAAPEPPVAAVAAVAPATAPSPPPPPSAAAAEQQLAERLVELAAVVGAAVMAGAATVDAHDGVEVGRGQRAHRDAVARQGLGVVLAGVAVVGLGVELVQQLLGGGMRTRGHR